MKFSHKATLIILATITSITQAAPMAPELTQAIHDGEHLFKNETFGGSGRVCNTCHLNGGTTKGQLPNGKPLPSLTNAAAIFPRFDAKANQVMTLADRIQGCIGGAIGGKPPELGSPELNNLQIYVTSLAQGKTLQMGGDPQ